MRKQLIVFLGILMTSSVAFAVTYSETTVSSHDHAGYVNGGFNRGGFVLGADYEHAYSRTYGLGGFARFYPKDDDTGVAGITTFGAFIRPHFHRRAWDLYVSPGFAVMSFDGVARDDETALGPALNIGLLYQIKRTLAIGIENTRMVAWFADDFKGEGVNDLMFKARFSF